MPQPKILVGCPTSDHKAYCLDAYLTTVKALSYPNYNLLLVDNSKKEDYFKLLKDKGVPVLRTPHYTTARERIVESRNLLRKKALEGDYDYLLSLEQDVIPPKDILEQLLSHKKPVITGIYYMHYTVKQQGKIIGKKVLPLLYQRKDEEHLIQLQPEEVEGNHLLEITATGLGCILIHKDILEKTPFRYEEEKLVFDDIWFCQDLEKEGVQLYVATSVKCKHLTTEMNWNKIKK